MSHLRREQRDLYWSIRQPSLMAENDSFPAEVWFKEQPISSTTDIRTPPERFRLGIHFEKIYQQWLLSHPDYQLIEANLQVQGLDRTLGEFDLLVKVNGLLEHWELAIKFYICIDDTANAARWFGPDPSDTLDGKISRLLEHQLGLGQRPEAVQLLNDKGLKIQKTRGIVKGRLYHAYCSDEDVQHHKTLNTDLPVGVAQNHLKGWWLRESDLQRLADKKIAYLDKKYWLSPVTAGDDVSVLNFEELTAFVQSSRQIAPQFVILDDQRNEYSRGFILKQDWFAQIPDATNRS